MFFIWNTVFLIQNVIKGFRAGPKNRVGRVTANKQFIFRPKAMEKCDSTVTGMTQDIIAKQDCGCNDSVVVTQENSYLKNLP